MSEDILRVRVGDHIVPALEAEVLERIEYPGFIRYRLRLSGYHSKSDAYLEFVLDVPTRPRTSYERWALCQAVANQLLQALISRRSP